MKVYDDLVFVALHLVLRVVYLSQLAQLRAHNALQPRFHTIHPSKAENSVSFRREPLERSLAYVIWHNIVIKHALITVFPKT